MMPKSLSVTESSATATSTFNYPQKRTAASFPVPDRIDPLVPQICEDEQNQFPAESRCGHVSGASALACGDPTPSQADIQMTKAIVQIATPLGISVHDHIIVGKNGHASFKGMKLI